MAILRADKTDFKTNSGLEVKVHNDKRDIPWWIYDNYKHMHLIAVAIFV